MREFLLKLLTPKTPDQIQQPTVRRGLFSTSTPPEKETRTQLMRRQQAAMAATFHRGIESLKPVDAAGLPATSDLDFAMDEAYPDLTTAKLANSRGAYLPIAQLEWFGNQGFIGWQMCAILSQNWLIDKVCGVPAQDAIRKGYETTLNDGSKLEPDYLNAIREGDRRMRIRKHAKQFVKKGRIFGIRHALFIIEGIDYELPFNPDGIRPGSYKGITQIDPYWIAPELDRAAAANPASPEFYNPTWWRVNGKRVHHTHFVIMCNGDDVVDILKPAYYYGGIPIPQKIYERVYAAERCANESPMLLLSKRLLTLKTDTTKIFGPNSNFETTANQTAAWRNNFGLNVIGEEEEMTQFETSLAELNETIYTQYALVCAAGNAPVTKIMGTPPKGMDATGEYDEANYHEEIEAIQDEIVKPLIERHHLCQMRSNIAPKFGIAPLRTEITFNPLDSYTTKEKAEINEIKSRTAKTYADIGAVDGTDVRQQIIEDPDSGYNGLDPIVPGGPGDREHEQEVQQQLLENSSAPQENKSEKEAQVMDEVDCVGVIYRAGDKILLMKRAPDRVSGGMWSFPAGHVDPGENSINAAQREFFEETGHRIKYFMADPVYADETFALYCVYGDQFTPMMCNEHTAYVWASLDNLPTPLHPGVAEQIKLAGYGAPLTR